MFAPCPPRARTDIPVRLSPPAHQVTLPTQRQARMPFLGRKLCFRQPEVAVVYWRAMFQPNVFAFNQNLMNPHQVGFAELLLFGLLAAGANLLGGFVLIRSGAHRFGERFLKYLVALGAGFMLAAIFIEIVPESFSIWTEGLEGESAAEAVVGAMTLLLGGYLLIQLFEHTLAPHFHFGA